MDLRWLHDNLSGPGVDELLQLLIIFLNSSLENSTQKNGDLSMKSSIEWRVESIPKTVKSNA